MSRGKIRFAALISAIFVLFINICAFAKVDIPNHTDRFFINDYANVIDSETEDYIFEKGKAYNANGGPQVVVLTMEPVWQRMKPKHLNGTNVQQKKVTQVPRSGSNGGENKQRTNTAIQRHATVHAVSLPPSRQATRPRTAAMGQASARLVPQWPS